MAQNINMVVLTGNLTRDPELRTTDSGMAIGSMRLAVNGRTKEDGEWVDKAEFYTVKVFGAQAENCAAYLEKGRPVAIEGRLSWHEWETDEGQHREAVEVIANQVQFLGGKPPRDPAEDEAGAPSGDIMEEPPEQPIEGGDFGNPPGFA